MLCVKYSKNYHDIQPDVSLPWKLWEYILLSLESSAHIISSNRYKSLVKWGVEPFFYLKVCMKAFGECTACALQDTENTKVFR